MSLRPRDAPAVPRCASSGSGVDRLARVLAAGLSTDVKRGRGDEDDVKRGQGDEDDPYVLSDDDEDVKPNIVPVPAPMPAPMPPSMPVPAPPPTVTVLVEPWDLVLHPTPQGKMKGYVTFKCTVKYVDESRQARWTKTGLQGSNVTGSAQGEWSFTTYSGTDTNMIPEGHEVIKRYLQKALDNGKYKNGQYYAKDGQLVNTPHPPAVQTLWLGLTAIGRMRAPDGGADPGLRPLLMQTLKLELNRKRREKGVYGDMSLGGIERWAFAPSKAWRDYADGSTEGVGR